MLDANSCIHKIIFYIGFVYLVLRPLLRDNLRRAGGALMILFTACTYYCKDANIQKLPITVTTEENDKSRIASMSCVNKVIAHSMEKIQQIISTVFIVSDGCASQFRSRFVFSLLTHIQQGIQIQWHYNEAHHGKGPMDGIGGTIKNLVFRRVLSEDVVINTPKEFATFADQISNIDCLFRRKMSCWKSRRKWRMLLRSHRH